jgi:hypothetical protein
VRGWEKLSTTVPRLPWGPGFGVYTPIMNLAGESSAWGDAQP